MPDFPSHIGPFEVRERLGTGGMGVVYLAYDPPLDRLVAVKVLNVDDDEVRQRFLREARFAARVQHPNIVAIYAVGEHRGRPYMAMEYIAGDTLASIIRGETTVSMGRRVQWLYELASGLEFAHRSGIVHRDVKPANLIVSRDSGLLRLLDFGIARDDDSDHTMAGHVIGTPSYMSPEQVTGGTVDARSDIFAFGLVAYELLSGTRAFQGQTTYETTRLIVEGEPESLGVRCPTLPGSLVETVHKCLAKSPDQRPASLVPVRADLRRVIHRLDPVDEPSLVRTVVRPGGAATLTPTTSTGDREKRRQRRRQQIEALVTRARAALAAGQLETAVEAAEQADLFDDRTPELSLLLHDIQQERHRRDLEARLQEVQSRIERGDLSSAEAALVDLEAQAPAEHVRPLREAMAAARLNQRVDRCMRDLWALLRSRDPDAAARRLAAESTDVRAHPRLEELSRTVEEARAAAEQRRLEAEAKRRADDEEARRRAEEEAERRRAEEDAERRRVEEEAERRRAEEEAERRRAEEEAEARRAAEEAEAKRRAEEEAERRRVEAEAERRRAEEEAEARRAAEEAEAKRRAEEEAERRRAEAEAERRRAEEEAERRRAEAEARRAAEEAEEAEKQRRADEEAEARRRAREADDAETQLRTAETAAPFPIPLADAPAPAPEPAPAPTPPVHADAAPPPPAPARPADELVDESAPTVVVPLPTVIMPSQPSTPAGATRPAVPARPADEAARVPAGTTRPPLPMPALAAAAAIVVVLLGGGLWLWSGDAGSTQTTPPTDSEAPGAPGNEPPPATDAASPPDANGAGRESDTGADTGPGETPGPSDDPKQGDEAPIEPPPPAPVAIAPEVRRLLSGGRLDQAVARWRQATDAPDRREAFSLITLHVSGGAAQARAAASARGAAGTPAFREGQAAEKIADGLARDGSIEATRQYGLAQAAFERATPPPSRPADTGGSSNARPTETPDRPTTDTRPSAQDDRSPAPPPPVQTPADQRPAVLAVLDAFAAAYNRRDLGGIAAVWPSMPAEWRRSLETSFRTFSDVQWTYTSRTLTIDGATARAVVGVTVRSTGSRGTVATDRRYTIELRRVDARWVITSVQLL